MLLLYGVMSMYKYNTEYKRELVSLYSRIQSVSDEYDTTIEMVLNDMSNYHLNNY